MTDEDKFTLHNVSKGSCFGTNELINSAEFRISLYMTQCVSSKSLATPLSLSPSQRSGTARESGNMVGFKMNSVQLLTVFTLNVEMWF